MLGIWQIERYRFVKNIMFSPPDISQREIDLVEEVLRSGWITTGKKTKEFENKLSEYCGTEKTACLNSATAALELALRLMGIGEGDEVIVPAYTYTASASPVIHVGATLVLVDVIKDTYELDYRQVAEKINERTKAIIPVDIAGIPMDYKHLYEIVEEKKHLFSPKNELQSSMGRVAVIADSAHGLGAVRDGMKTGRLADITTFSFHAVKNLTTAEGGALTWNTGLFDSEELYHQIQLLSLHGQSKAALDKTMLGKWEYDIVSASYKCNMTDISAALGLGQLERYDKMIKRRHEIIKYYDTALADLNVDTAKHIGENYTSSGHLYLTRTRGISERERNLIIDEMAQSGIACNVHYKPLPMMTAYKNLGFDIKDFPNSYKQYENEITLPLHTLLGDDDVEYIAEKFSDCVKKYSK